MHVRARGSIRVHARIFALRSVRWRANAQTSTAIANFHAKKPRRTQNTNVSQYPSKLAELGLVTYASET